jgi:hypothetical protein
MTQMADNRGHESEFIGFDGNADTAGNGYTARQISSNQVETFAPRAFDVLLGRGRWYASHAGNRRLQVFINMYLERYQATKLRPEKTYITNEILHMVKTCGKQPGRFLKFDEEINGWVAVNDEVARLKISQAMRYTIRTPQEGGLLPSMQTSADDAVLDQLESRTFATESSPVHNAAINGLLKQDPSTNLEMGPPPPRLPMATMVQSPFKNDHDAFSRSDWQDDRESEEETPDDKLILSDEAILRSLGYAVPKPKKRKSTGDIPVIFSPL